GYAMVAAGSDALFHRLAAALGAPRLADDARFTDNPSRVRHRGELVAALSAITRELKTADLLERLRVAGVPSAPILTVDAVLAEPAPMTAPYRHLLVERSADGFVVTVTLNRPEQMNAMNTAMGADLLACFDGLHHDPLVRAVVITGAGDRAFCAGGDLKERNEMTDEAWRAQHVIFEQAASRILKTPVPVIAAVEGFALAGGCELATLADF